MRVYSRCRHCNSLLPNIARKPDAFCENYQVNGEWVSCRKEHNEAAKAAGIKRASKKFNVAWVIDGRGRTMIQEPLWGDDE